MKSRPLGYNRPGSDQSASTSRTRPPIEPPTDPQALAVWVLVALDRGLDEAATVARYGRA